MNKNVIATKTKKRPFKVNWSEEEDKILWSLAGSDNRKSWKSISILLNNKTPSQCFYRFHSLNSPVSKKNWTTEEDKIIKDFVKLHGKKWDEIANLLNLRSAKQIKERFLNKLDESLIRSKFTEEEDQRIIGFYIKYGSKWSYIAKNFQGRTPVMLKSRFYSNLQKRILLGNCQNNNNNCNNDILEMDLSNDKIIQQDEKLLDMANLSSNKNLKFNPQGFSRNIMIAETEDNTPKSCNSTVKSKIQINFKAFCNQQIDNDETLTDISFDEDSDKESNNIAFSDNKITENTLKEDGIKSDFDHKSFSDLINVNEIMSIDLKNANLNYNDNNFYCEKINEELISFIENDDCENVFDVLEY